MFLIVAGLASISSCVTASAASNLSSTSTLSRPHASRVNSILRAMNCSSFSSSFGSTLKDCTKAGYAKPPKIETMIHSPTAKAGTRHPLLTIPLMIVASPAKSPITTSA